VWQTPTTLKQQFEAEDNNTNTKTLKKHVNHMKLIYTKSYSVRVRKDDFYEVVGRW